MSAWTMANHDGYKDQSKSQNQRSIITQSVISIALGLFAFLAFCFLRPRWTSLYAARKRQKNAASILPELPDSFFGWIPALYRITEDQVLASAGLDAFVFLHFFKMATKYIAITFFFSLVVLLPIHVHDTGNYGLPDPGGNYTANSTTILGAYGGASPILEIARSAKAPKGTDNKPTDLMLWIYVVFVYLFSLLALYLIITETKEVIRIRQDYLGSQSTVTDRTIRLSGIPEALRSEEMIKEAIENLQIGKVESVLLCRDWKELDDLVARRTNVLRKLEEAWTVHLGRPRHGGNRVLLRASGGDANPADDHENLLDGNSNEQPHVDSATSDRPMTRIWHGFLGLQSLRIDAIDYYEEKLRKLDEEINSSRQKVYKPTPLAFVTLDSTAAAQMAVQATMDPEPMKLLANVAPPPSDVVWQNTYLPRSSRMLRAWSITLVIAILTVFWSLLLVPLAGLLSLENIGKVWPQLADALSSHDISRSLVQQGLPTLLISLLSVAVPYLYYWLSTLQGMISQGEVEMSLISKNFFFTFFNLFVVFTIFGTASNAQGYFTQIGDSLKDTTSIAYVLANSLKNLVLFYINLIILQGLGLFPFRLLEFGSVALYPIYLIGAKTPRDYAELVQPPIFSYGFYLPQTILIFIICIVYSVLPGSWFVLFFGLLYFIIGTFIYKYQLLYAMDHRQHSTGRAWSIICNRIVLGLVVFQLAMAGILGLSLAVYRAVVIVPLIAFTVWFIVFYQRTYEPLMRFIAIRSLTHDPPFGALALGESRYDTETSMGRDVDEDQETGLRYINPSLITPLEDVWLAKRRTNGSAQNGDHAADEDPRHRQPIFFISASFRRATVFTTSSQILLSRGVAGLDPEQADCLDPTSSAPLLTIFEDASVHILYIGQSSTPEITRLAGDRPTRFGMGPSELDSTKDARPLANSYRVDTPLRAKASPRSTPSNSVRSSFSFRAASERAESSTPSEEGSPIRGRTLARVPAYDRLEAQAMTRIRQRFLSRDLSGEPGEIDGCYMEPLPLEGFRSSLSEELHKATTFNSSIDLTKFGGHRDTFAILGLPRTQTRGPELPATFFHRLLSYIDFDAYLAIRLSCRCWSTSITQARPVIMPSVYNIPAEILENIYSYLSPIDLNAARHTCRAWMIGSLEEKLLTRVLKEGGWWRAAKADIDLHENLKGYRTADSVSEEWLLGKRLATECSLRPDWTGNGLSAKLLSSPGRECNLSGIALTSETDFSELSTGYNPSRMGSSQHGSAVHFTVSVCCKFLLVTEGCLIYVYSLRDNTSKPHPYGGYLSPVTTVVCPHRVLAVSMDTSFQRFAVAALLEGRVGLVCDLHESTLSSSQRRSTPQGPSNIMSDCRASIYSSVSSGEPLVTDSTSQQPEQATFPSTSSDRALARPIAEASVPGAHGAHHAGVFWQMDDPHGAAAPRSSGGSSTNASYIPSKAGYTPLETGVRSVYRSLCSAEDLPRSVAICPQRRCVAFGCSGGIELHWVDALTGQDLNRWFPLTAPSDFLYFLPPRPGVDSAKKLRLISSACHPKEKEGLVGRFFPGTSTSAANHHSMTWDEGLSDPGAWDQVWRGSGWCDHYRAVPVSDGWSVLFTDPMEGSLCLGTDSPPGFGATKLTRRFIFMGPEELETTAVPRVYAAGSELRWGVRIAVGYGEAIWLFVLPPDVYFAPQDKPAERQYAQDTTAIKEPMKVEGIKIGHMQGLVDLAVDASGGDLTIWSFAVDGMAYAWQIASRQDFVEKRVVLKDGTVMALQDADGDTYMSNTSQAAVHFDGTAPLRPTFTGATCLHPFLRPSVDDIFLGFHDRVIDHARVVDHDGDINMPDAEDEGYVSGGPEEEEEGDEQPEPAQAGGGGAVSAIHALPLWDRWSEGEDDDGDADWVTGYLAQRGGEGGIEDEGLGIDVLGLTRLEVEVLCG